MQILLSITAISSGLLAGALLTEARILVPYWKKMLPEEFSRLHHTMSPSLFRFYAPLTVVGTLFPIATYLASFAEGDNDSSVWTLVSALCAATLLIFYATFFRKANISFASETDERKVQETLSKWASLHSLRTGVSVLGFFAAVIASSS